MKDLIQKILRKINTSMGPSHIKPEDFLLLWSSIREKEKYFSLQDQTWFEWQQKWSSLEKTFSNNFSMGSFLEVNKQLRSVTKVSFALENNSHFKISKNGSEIASTNLNSETMSEWKNSLLRGSNQYFNFWNKILKSRKLSLIGEDFEAADLNETKAIQWLKATFHVLEGALEKTKSNPDHMVTSHILLGQLPLQDDYILQLSCFNVEILCKLNMKNQQQLYVLAYDLKDQEKLTPEMAKNPVLKASIVYRKEELFQVIESFFDKLQKTSLGILGKLS